MNPFFSILHHPQRRGGFSLTEVSVALAVASFAIIPLLGLLASGLGQARSNQERFIQSQIANWVGGTLRTEGAPAPGAGDFYFDSMGLPANSAAGAIFAARVESRTIALPGASSSLQAWRVEISSPARNYQSLGEKVVWAERR